MRSLASSSSSSSSSSSVPSSSSSASGWLASPRALVAACALLAASCSGNSATTPGDMAAAVMCPKPGGPAVGPADTHCQGDGGVIVQPTSQASCSFQPDLAGPQPDAGSDGTSGEFGATMYGTAAADDDCKYDVSYTVTTVCENADVYFTVVATSRATGKPATGAAVDAQVYLSDTHPAPNSSQAVKETTPGTYLVGPVRFDAAGQWTVRFHLFETCSDALATSPHGHAAFYLDVP